MERSAQPELAYVCMDIYLLRLVNARIGDFACDMPIFIFNVAWFSRYIVYTVQVSRMCLFTHNIFLFVPNMQTCVRKLNNEASVKRPHYTALLASHAKISSPICSRSKGFAKLYPTIFERNSIYPTRLTAILCPLDPWSLLIYWVTDDSTIDSSIVICGWVNYVEYYENNNSRNIYYTLAPS